MKIYLRLLKLMAPFAWLVALAILLGSITIASNMLLLSMAAYLISDAALVSLMISLTLPSYIVRAMGVVRPLSRYFERVISHDVTFRLLTQIRVQVYTALEPLLPAQKLNFRSGDMLTRLISDVDELQNVYLQGISPLAIWLLVTGLTYSIFMIFSPLLAWVALTFLVLAGIVVPLLTGLLTRRLGRRRIAARAELKAHLVDGIQGMQDLLTCGSPATQSQKIAGLDSVLGRVQRRMATVSGLQLALNDALMQSALWVLLVLAIPLVVTKTISGVYLAFLALLILASFEAVVPLAQAVQLLGSTLAAGERLFSVIDTVPQVVDHAGPLPAPEKLPVHTLEFEHVSFAYSPNEGNVLDDISFSLSPGKRIAIVGPSGAGKSTLVSLALRFWDPTCGSIRLDGQDIRKYALDDLRSIFGVVAQDTYLFNDTLRNNLLLARPEASGDELACVLEQAGLSEMVRQLPRGLETWIGEQGLRLSGGERQRLSVARALLKDAPFLLLDEVTANLDPLTEHALLAVLNTLMQDRITLIITHRLLALESMDEILVLDQGCICQRGTHEELARADGLYRSMLAVQNETVALAE